MVTNSSELEKTLWGPGKLLSNDPVSTKGKDVRVLNQYTNSSEMVKLDLYQRLALALGKYVKESERRYEGWSGSLPFYVFEFRAGERKYLMLDYSHGHGSGYFNVEFRG